MWTPFTIREKPAKCCDCGRTIPIGEEAVGDWQNGIELKVRCKACHHKRGSY